MKAVNLLPSDTRGATKASTERTVVVTDDSSSFGAYAVLGALALAVLALAGVVLTGNSIKDRESELAGIKAEQAQLAGKVAQLKPYAEFDQLASERVATVRDLAGRRFDWEQAIRDMSRAIPADVTLSELTGNVSTDAGGGGSNELRGAIAAPAITITGCSVNQRSVARLMARMRLIDGVTRVSLSKSEAAKVEGETIGAGVTSAADLAAARRAAPCGKGKRPQFDIVMFFEGDAEAATGPSASPGQAGATPPSSTAKKGAGTSTPASTTQGGVSP